MTQTVQAHSGAARPAAGASPRLYSTAFYLWLAAAAPALVGLLFWALVARLYDTEQVGAASAALAAASLLATFSHLGLGAGLIRFLPETPPRSAARLINAVLTVSAACAALFAAVFLLGVRWWTPGLRFLVDQPAYSAGFVLLVALATVSGIQNQVLIAAKRPAYILAQVLVVQTSRLALPALAVVYLGAFGIVAAAAGAVTAGAAAGFGLLRWGLPGYRPGLVIDARAVSGLLPFSAANYAADLLLMTPALLLPLIVVGMLGSTAGAYFFMAWFLGQLLTAGSANLALSLFAEGSHNPSSLHFLSRNAVVAGLLVAALGAAVLVGLGDRLLLVFGRAYAEEGAALLRLVALAALPAAVVNVYLGALRVTKHLGELVMIAALMATVTLALSCALLPTIGLEAVGIAYAAAQALGLLVVMARLLLGAADRSVGQNLQRLWRLLAAGS
ncbi:MAG TPA: oligosaccharide flippase family protein [Dehalococcoidia bacterium]|nr:oligosaccharide flippase family protein [Dehalococcoidia bacterium]